MGTLNESPIRIKSFQFACDIVLYCDILKKNNDFELASQLLKSGTSIGQILRKHKEELVKKILNISLVLRLRRQTKRCIG